MSCVQNTSLTNLIRDITMKYIKFYYDKKCTELKKQFMCTTEVHNFVDDMYNEKEQNLKDYIRKSLKKIYSDSNEEYPLTSVENIMLEISSDKEFSKERVINEIFGYQKSKGYIYD